MEEKHREHGACMSEVQQQEAAIAECQVSTQVLVVPTTAMLGIMHFSTHTHAHRHLQQLIGMYGQGGCSFSVTDMPTRGFADAAAWPCSCALHSEQVPCMFLQASNLTLKESISNIHEERTALWRLCEQMQDEFVQACSNLQTLTAQARDSLPSCPHDVLEELRHAVADGVKARAAQAGTAAAKAARALPNGVVDLQDCM